LEINGQQVLRVVAEQVHDLLLYLRDEAKPAFTMLTDFTALHLPERDKPFDLVYMPYALIEGRRLRIKTAISEGEVIESACDIWSTANWLEREVYDLMGVRFAKHPDLRRILLPPGWQGHPLRKDYPLEYQDNVWTAQNLKIRELPTEGDYTGKFE
jgi:NADH-quinone oxidoreductase subunit C